MLTRRDFLSSSTLLAGFFVFKPFDAFAQEKVSSLVTPSDRAAFYHASTLLTNRKKLNDTVALRALEGLLEADSAFSAHFRMLWSALQSAKITQVSQLNSHVIMQNAQHSMTIKKIISAWYLGYTGTPIELRAVDNTHFVTYTDALMYESTIDATVIPTYSRGKTNYWVKPPETIKND